MDNAFRQAKDESCREWVVGWLAYLSPVHLTCALLHLGLNLWGRGQQRLLLLFKLL